jgi:hypothetical protein
VPAVEETPVSETEVVSDWEWISNERVI